jgi:hypothetical protein
VIITRAQVIESLKELADELPKNGLGLEAACLGLVAGIIEEGLAGEMVTQARRIVTNLVTGKKLHEVAAETTAIVEEQRRVAGMN